MFVHRLLEEPIRAALVDTPVLLLVGARQVGKTTLAKSLTDAGGTFRSLDVAAHRAAARADPDGFVQAPGPLVIDEVQRVPELLLAVKAAVDRTRVPGAFILTGSADVMTLPAVADSLAGRVEIQTLHPLSIAEVAGERRSFLDALHDGRPAHAPIDRDGLVRLLLAGGFPEARARTGRRRDAWFRDYIETVVQREVPAIADIRYADEVPRLLRLIAAGSPGMLNLSGLSASIGVPRTTIDRYVAILRQLFLVRLLPAWHANVATRQVKSLRMLTCDPGLHAHLLELDERRLADWHPEKVGALLETLVAAELSAQSGWAERTYQLHWWRTAKGVEVDFVIEARDGALMGIEVTSSSSVRSADFRGLRALQAATGDRFHRGVVLYTGSEPLSFGSGLEAWPITTLWGGRAVPPSGLDSAV